MYKQTIEYTDFNGLKQKGDFYFNLTEPEVIEMQLGSKNGFSNYIETLRASNNQAKIIKAFEEMVLKAYGEKSEDGQRFVKSKKIRNNFKHSAAYPEFYLSLAMDSELASAFMDGIFPEKFKENSNFQKELAKAKGEDYRPPTSDHKKKEKKDE